MTKPLTPLAKHSDGESLLLKTNYKDPAKRYELAERIVWSKLDKWKKQVIIQCKLTGSKYTAWDKSKENGIEGGAEAERILDEYAHEISMLAESDREISRGESLPPVPAYTLESEKAADAAQQL